MLLPLLMNNLLETGGPAPTPEVAGAVSSAGGGSWWEGEWIIPGVTHYLPKKPPEDVAPDLRPKVARARKRLVKIKSSAPEYKSLHGKLSALTRSIVALEGQAEAAIKAKETEAAIDAVTARYRELADTTAQIELQIAVHEADMHRKRLMMEDDEFLQIIMEML